MRTCVFSLLLIGVSCLLGSCVGDLNSPLYGIVVIKSPSGEQLFFREEARGLNFDQVILSTNRDYCSEPDSSSDIIFEGEGVPLFYKFEDDSLHLYMTGSVTVPVKFSSKIKIAQHQIDNLDFVEMKKNYQKDGLSYLDTFYNESLKCE